MSMAVGKKPGHNDGYQHRRHNKNLLLVHLIFVTKYRKKILKGAFGADVKQYIYDACQSHHWYIRRMDGTADHIHILLQYNPADSVTKIVSMNNPQGILRFQPREELGALSSSFAYWLRMYRSTVSLLMLPSVLI